MIDRILDTISHRVFLGVQPQGNANHCIKVANCGECPAVCRDASQNQDFNDLIAEPFVDFTDIGTAIQFIFYC
jgi:hypothetical protein